MIDLMLVLKSRGSMDGSSMDAGSINNGLMKSYAALVTTPRRGGRLADQNLIDFRNLIDSRPIETFIMMSRIVVEPKQRSFGLGWWDAEDQKKQPAPDGVASSNRGLWSR